jgi:hypothetical protein
MAQMDDAEAIEKAIEFVEKEMSHFPDANLLFGVSLGSVAAWERAVSEGRLRAPVFIDSRLLPCRVSVFVRSDEFLAEGRFDRARQKRRI